MLFSRRWSSAQADQIKLLAFGSWLNKLAGRPQGSVHFQFQLQVSCASSLFEWAAFANLIKRKEGPLHWAKSAGDEKQTTAIR